jgi:D-alanine-D-alanine ligase
LRAAGVEAFLFGVHEHLAHVLSRKDCVVVFPVEERCAQVDFTDEVGLRRVLENARVPFVGSGADSVARASNKIQAKAILRAAEIAVPTGVVAYVAGSGDVVYADGAGPVAMPAVVKPAVGGGSRGVSFVETELQLEHAITQASVPTGSEVVVEQFVEGSEFTVWILGVDPCVHCHAIIPLVKHGRRIYDAAAKAGAPSPGGMLASSRESGERDRSTDSLDAIRSTAIRAHHALGAYSYSRIDVILRNKTPVVLEVNTRPHLRPSGALAIASRGGQTFGELMSMLVKHALRRPP